MSLTSKHDVDRSCGGWALGQGVDLDPAGSFSEGELDPQSEGAEPDLRWVLERKTRRQTDLEGAGGETVTLSTLLDPVGSALPDQDAGRFGVGVGDPACPQLATATRATGSHHRSAQSLGQLARAGGGDPTDVLVATFGGVGE